MTTDPTPAKPNSVSRCPLCGENNLCAVAAGEPVTECWCYSACISPALLDRLPEEERGKRCICQHCVQTEGVKSIEG